MQMRVRYAETDAAGIVHYARYLGYLKAARAEALRAAGLSSEMIATYSLHAWLLQAVIRYRASAKFDDLLDVHARVLDVSEPQFRFAYEIQRPGDQVVIATSETRPGLTHNRPLASTSPPGCLRR
jgi:acyl-CoA thioester hydrolase